MKKNKGILTSTIVTGTMALFATSRLAQAGAGNDSFGWTAETAFNCSLSSKLYRLNCSGESYRLNKLHFSAAKDIVKISQHAV